MCSMSESQSTQLVQISPPKKTRRKPQTTQKMQSPICWAGIPSDKVIPCNDTEK